MDGDIARGPNILTYDLNSIQTKKEIGGEVCVCVRREGGVSSPVILG